MEMVFYCPTCNRETDNCSCEKDQLRAELVNALAACKVKDVTLESAHNGLRWWMDAFPLHVTEADNKEMLKLVKALTIQPDDDALKAWLGEPVWVAQSETYSQFVNGRPRKIWYECTQGVGIPFYSPKELK